MFHPEPDASCLEVLERAKFQSSFKELIQDPSCLIANLSRHSAINSLLALEPPHSLIDIFINLWSTFPSGTSQIAKTYREDTVNTDIALRQSLELCLVVSVLSGETKAIKESLYSLSRFLTIGEMSYIPSRSSEEEDLCFEDFIGSLEFELKGIRGVLCTIVIDNPDIMPLLDSHLEDFIEFKALIYRDLLEHFAYQPKLSSKEYRVASLVQGGVGRLVGKIAEAYSGPEPEDDYEVRTIQEYHPCLGLNEKLLLSLACFNARHGSDQWATDYCERGKDNESVAIVRAFLLKRSEESSFPSINPSDYICSPDFLRREKDPAFRITFLSELVGLRLLNIAQSYLTDMEENAELRKSQQNIQMSAICKLVIGYADVNPNKSLGYLSRIFDYLKEGNDPCVVINLTIRTIEDVLCFPFIQDAIIQEFKKYFKDANASLLDLENIDDLYQTLILSKRFDVLDDFYNFVSTIMEDSGLIADAYIEGVSNLYDRGEYASAELCFEKACRFLEFDLDFPKMDQEQFLQNSAYRHQILHLLRSSLVVRNEGFARNILLEIQSVAKADPDHERSSGIANDVDFILSEDLLRRAGKLSNPLLRRYFDNYLNMLGPASI